MHKKLNVFVWLLACIEKICLAQTEDEIGEYTCLTIEGGDETLRDHAYNTKYEVAQTDPTNQFIKYDWSSCGGATTVNAILIETDETRMSSGEIKFFIDGVECPNTNGVGVGAVGGVFNCGLNGSTFEARCTTLCTPFMSIVEIFLWKA